MRAIMCLTLIWRESQFQCSTSVLPSIAIYQSKDQFRGRFDADEYADQAAIFAQLATRASPPTSLQHSGWKAT